MRRLAIFALAALVMPWLQPEVPAYAAIPAPQIVDGQNPPSLAPIIKRVANAVVSISVRTTMPEQNSLFDDPLLRQLFGLPDMQARESMAAGSGVVIDARKGLVVTNYHVIENADDITVTFADGRQAKAMLRGSDPDTDVAVIDVPPMPGLTAIPFGDSEKLEVGDYVLAIGNPFGIGQTVTSGIVSGLNRNAMGLEGYEDFIQTDASINPGNSGGALINLKGELVGINAALLGSNTGNSAFGFAIPISMVRAIADQLVEYGTVERGDLGLQVATAQSGAVVRHVDPDSPAARAGVKTGDVITRFGGKPVSDAAGLRNKLALLRVGAAVEMTVLRAGRPLRVNATLAALALKTLDGKDVSPLFDGALLTNSDADAREKGAQVATVTAGSKAAVSGLHEGDVIVSVNRKRVIGLDQLVSEVTKSPARLVLNVLRGGQPVLLTIREDESLPGKIAP
jgi:Do/DeqQ family serine protease